MSVSSSEGLLIWGLDTGRPGDLLADAALEVESGLNELGGAREHSTGRRADLVDLGVMHHTFWAQDLASTGLSRDADFAFPFLIATSTASGRADINLPLPTAWQRPSLLSYELGLVSSAAGSSTSALRLRTELQVLNAGQTMLGGGDYHDDTLSVDWSGVAANVAKTVPMEQVAGVTSNARLATLALHLDSTGGYHAGGYKLISVRFRSMSLSTATETTQLTWAARNASTSTGTTTRTRVTSTGATRVTSTGGTRIVTS